MAADFDYTSARLKTQGLFSHAYGRFEARIKLPAGAGTLARVLDVGRQFRGVSRLAEMRRNRHHGKCGQRARHQSRFACTGRVPQRNATKRFDRDDHATRRQALSNDFHVYASSGSPTRFVFIWTPICMRRSPLRNGLPGGTWIFDHRFFFILNVAVGGDWPGSPDDTSLSFRKPMLVDYVRVYSTKRSGPRKLANIRAIAEPLVA